MLHSRARDADSARVTDTPDTDAPEPTPHPLQRAHRFFQKAAPVIRDVNETIERHGGIEQVRGKVIERAGEIARRIDETVTNAAAIEGKLITREDTPPIAFDAPQQATHRRTPPRATPVTPHRSPLRFVAIAIVAAAATYGAIRVQRCSDSP